MSSKTENYSKTLISLQIWISVLLFVFLSGISRSSAQDKCDPNLLCLNCTGTSPLQYCTSCPIGYALTKESLPKCQACPYQCSVCEIGRPCQQCYPKTGPTTMSPYSCTSCPSNCVSCQTNVSICETCDVSYYLYPNKTCGLCADYCTTYHCVNNGAGQCDRCDLGYGLTPTNTCAPCDSNCNKTIGCNTNGTCIQCNGGYGLAANKTCDSCADNCTTYHCLINGAGKCDRCDLDYGLTPTNTCAPCDSNCNKTIGCNTNGTCIQCKEGYGLTANKKCDPCADNCTTFHCLINGAGKCDRCDLDYGLTPTNTCAPCDPNCNSSIGCDFNGTCLQCRSGFVSYDNKTCSAITTTTTKATTTATTTTATTTATTTTTTAKSTATITTTTPTAKPTITSTGPLTATPPGISTTFSQSSSSGTIVVLASVSSNSDTTWIGYTGSTENPINGTSNSNSPVDNGSGTGLDWRVPFTLAMLIFGGLLITAFACFCWCSRFHPLEGRPYYRRYIFEPSTSTQKDVTGYPNADGVRKRTN